MRDGYRDGVIVYHLDRLARRPMELEQFIAVCECAGVRDVITVTADVDMGNGEGLCMARISVAVAAKESARKSERVKHKLRQNAEMGLPGGEANRPFGFEPDKLTIHEWER
ncbi:recombinase family protein [Aeromicrobium phoceense]|uniref:recombinase family protein n=1 Tax=Aeromicrobium phoceense TaxID=2754045 RepID=UPI0030B82DAC